MSMTIQDLQASKAHLERDIERIRSAPGVYYKEMKKCGQQLGNLRLENERLTMPLTSCWRVAFRCRKQLGAFFSGTSLTAIRRTNTLLIRHLEDKHETASTHYFAAVQLLANKEIVELGGIESQMEKLQSSKS